MSREDFKDKLESIHKWPSYYMFKFIVPKASKDELVKLLEGHDLQIKNSGKGNYISVTSKKMINDSDEVLDIYEDAHKIDGIIAL